ncbi:hypothetical protein NIIDMKKI_49360 [Mycobacterium kansasii]|uniref:Lipoprotein n=1 Tax=Mycobacterium kansasii TaxID=1768 RepID=A0A7G1IFX4_MYCKA|nr:hypothetical protein NIIDMKKI_49360 [Mycobacterium kansasii]
MRARPLTMLTAAAAVALVVVAACEAKVQAKAYSTPDHSASHYPAQPQQQLVELLLRAIARPAHRMRCCPAPG